MQVFKIDENGMFVEPVIIEQKVNEASELYFDIPDDCVKQVPKEGLYHPKWDGVSWVEGMPQTEIDLIKSKLIDATTEPDPLEVIILDNMTMQTELEKLNTLVETLITSNLEVF